VAYALRGGALLSSLVATMPLWKSYDPLPVLAMADEKKKAEKKKKTRAAGDVDKADERDEVAALFD